MKHIEKLQDFYDNLPQNKDHSIISNNRFWGHFNILPRWHCVGSYVRRDFYKLVLVIGTGILRYADKEIIIDRPGVFLTNPLVPYSWQPLSEKQEGWICLFTPEFIQQDVAEKQNYPILYQTNNPVFFFNDEDFNYISSLFDRIATEIRTDYIYKFSIIRNYLHLLIHEIQKHESSTRLDQQQPNAARRRTFQFLELLEQQFPIESPEVPLKLKTPLDFANAMSIHVNHLNSAIKSTTGKTSSQLIVDYVIKEAKALLQNTDWDIAGIAYALGFEYPSHFTNFVRKRTGLSPKEIRNQNI